MHSWFNFHGHPVIHSPSRQWLAVSWNRRVHSLIHSTNSCFCDRSLASNQAQIARGGGEPGSRLIGLCVNREFAVNFYHNLLTSSSTARSATLSEADTPTDKGINVNIQTNKYTQLIQTSVAIDMEGHEKFEEEPYQSAQKIGL